MRVRALYGDALRVIAGHPGGDEVAEWMKAKAREALNKTSAADCGEIYAQLGTVPWRELTETNHPAKGQLVLACDAGPEARAAADIEMRVITWPGSHLPTSLGWTHWFPLTPPKQEEKST